MTWNWLIVVGALACLLGCMRAVRRCFGLLAECVRERRVVERIKDEIWARLDGSEGR